MRCDVRMPVEHLYFLCEEHINHNLKKIFLGLSGWYKIIKSACDASGL